jgi:hypothetical protein
MISQTASVVVAEGETFFINLVSQLAARAPNAVKMNIHFVGATVAQQVSDHAEQYL